MIVGIGGSGRKEGNSSRLLCEALAAAATTSSPQTSTFFLAEKTFRGCIGCLGCRTGADQCVLRDDLTDILAVTGTADALLLATPIYYGYPTGLFKSYLDRWYSFRDGSRNLRVPTGRPALLIVTQGHPDPQSYSWTLGSLEKVLNSYGFDPGVFVATGLEGPEDVLDHPDYLTEIRRLGKELLAE